jgi:hypothetical protein
VLYITQLGATVHLGRGYSDSAEAFVPRWWETGSLFGVWGFGGRGAVLLRWSRILGSPNVDPHVEPKESDADGNPVRMPVEAFSMLKVEMTQGPARVYRRQPL